MHAAADNQELRELYRELILDHARSPRGFGVLDGATHRASGINPLCGDRLELYVALDADERITNVCFEGSGCAISVASASLLTETVRQLSTCEARDFVAALTAHLRGDDDAPTSIELGKLRALEGVREFPSRVKCATLAWHALEAALNHEQAASTE